MDEFDPWTHLARMGCRMRQPNDSFFADGDGAAGVRTPILLTQEDTEEFLHKDLPEFPCSAPDCPVTFSQLIDFELHYATLHKHECSQCGQTMPSAHLLELHLAETHDSFFAIASRKKKSFECFLQRCRDKFWTAADRRLHCLAKHQFPQDFKFDNISKVTCDTNATADQMETESVQEEPSEKVILRKRSDEVRRSATRPSSLSPKLKASHLRKTSNKLRRPQSVMVVDSGPPSPVKEIPGSRIPVATFGSEERRASRGNLNRPFSVKKSSAFLPSESSSSSNEVEMRDKITTNPDEGSDSPRRRVSLAMITGFSPRSSTERDAVSEPKTIISPLSSSLVDVPARRQSAPLSLARMGERLEQKRPSVTDEMMIHPSSGSTTGSPKKSPSRIPIFKRSQSLKVPKQICFGSDVEKAFHSDKTHWHSRADGQRAPSNSNALAFEVDMRGALDDCTF